MHAEQIEKEKVAQPGNNLAAPVRLRTVVFANARLAKVCGRGSAEFVLSILQVVKRRVWHAEC